MYRMWKMTPIENISHFSLYFPLYPFFAFRTSGATYPGVPHLVYKYFYALTNSASPMSTITISGFYFESFLTIMFSNLRSRCIIPLVCICSMPFRSWKIIFLASSRLGNPYFCIQPNRDSPRFSMAIYVEFYVQ